VCPDGRGWMSKEDLIELQGVVTEVLAGGNYKVKCGENHEVLARLNGKMRQFRIRVIQGDRVTVGVSPYDLKRGLITYRAKGPRAARTSLLPRFRAVLFDLDHTLLDFDRAQRIALRRALSRFALPFSPATLLASRG